MRVCQLGIVTCCPASSWSDPRLSARTSASGGNRAMDLLGTCLLLVYFGRAFRQGQMPWSSVLLLCLLKVPTFVRACRNIPA